MRNRQIFICIFFLFFIALFPASYIVTKDYIDTSNNENRELAKMPKFSLEEIELFPLKFDYYVNDNLPYKNQLTKWHSLLELRVYRKSTSDAVTVGDGDWLFYTTKTDGTPMEQYFGRDLYSEEELALIADNLVTTQEYLAQQNAEFVVFVAPNKERIYSEYLPSYYDEPAEMYGTKQIIKYLEENTDLRIVYAYNALMKEKEASPDITLYYLTDSHWNRAGGYVGTRELLKELDIEFPTLQEVNLEQNPHGKFDLAGLINMRDVYTTDINYAITGYGGERLVNEKYDFNTEYIYHNEGMDSRRLLVVRDSFADAMDGFLASQFNETYMVHNTYFSQSMVEEWQPDIVVYECVERYIDRLLEFRME